MSVRKDCEKLARVLHS